MPHVDTPNYHEYAKLRNNRTFKSLMEQAIELAADIKVLETQYKDVKESLDKLLAEAEVEGSVLYNGWRVSIINKEGKPKLDMKKLLRILGPKGPTLVKQAMEPGKPSHYVQISPPSKTDDEEGGNE